MKIPKEVKVSPRTLELRADHGACHASNARGQYLGDDGYIIYDEQRPADLLREVILHECLHAIFDVSSLKIRYPDEGEDSEGEKLIQDLAPRILALLRENPELVKWITK